MYAIAVGHLKKGEEPKEIEYKEVARAERLIDLFDDFCQAMEFTDSKSDKQDIEVFRKCLAETEHPCTFISRGENTSTLGSYKSRFGTWNKKTNKRNKNGYGAMVRIIEVQ